MRSYTLQSKPLFLRERVVFVSSVSIDLSTFSAPYYWNEREETLVRDIPFLYKSLLYGGIGIALVTGTGVYLHSDTASYLIASGSFGLLIPSALLQQVNAFRFTHGLAPLQDDPLLDKVAQAKAEDMASRQYYGHTDPQGKTIFQTMHEEVGGYGAVGETLALGFDTPGSIITAWDQDPASLRSITSAVYTKAGVGIARGKWRDGTSKTFVVLEVGSDQSTF